MYHVISKETATHFQWGNTCDGWVLIDTEGLSVKQEMMPPGIKEKWHYHNRAQQLFFVLTGMATFYLDKETGTVSEQQGLLIPAGAKHYTANGTTEPLHFLVISQSTTNNDRSVVESSTQLTS